MIYNCTLKHYPTQPNLVVCTKTSVQQLPQVMGQAYGEIAQHLAVLGKGPAGPPFTVYHNMDMQNLEVEIGFPVAMPVSGTETITAGEIPGGQYATCIHLGPYNEIHHAYEALSKWVDENDYQASGIAYEMYLNDPEETAPQARETEVAFPVSAV